MTRLQEYDTVRVVRLIQSERFFDGSEEVRRPPRVGDIATICHEYAPDDPSAAVAVEMTDSEGLTVWLADFERCELALVQRG